MATQVETKAMPHGKPSEEKEPDKDMDGTPGFDDLGEKNVADLEKDLEDDPDLVQ